ncbi:hypothetical protein FWH13_03940 [Candidatus Saccharibacteria bacterium]|nr:hypothetical protein [Candidatus Saccharibacteria bacterium]
MNAKRSTSTFQRFNSWLASKLAIIMSSMWLFWVLTIVIVVAGLLQPPSDPYMFVMFVISAGFQAIALPVLAFVSNIQGDRQEKVMREVHEATMKELEMMRQENAALRKLLSESRRLVKEVDDLDVEVDDLDSELDDLKK